MFARKWVRAATAITTAAATAIFSSDAAAHGGIPRAYEILSESESMQHLILRSYLWGFFRSSNGGDTWQYTCAEAYKGKSTIAETRSIAMVPGGRTLVANYFEGLHMTDDGCEWRKHPDIPDVIVTDVRLDPHVEGRLHLATTIGDAVGYDSRLYRSDDRGDTWQQSAAQLPADFSPNQIDFALSDPQKLYVVGKGYGDGTTHFLRSSDGGTTFERFPIPIERERWLPRIQAIHPSRPEVIFLWVDGEEGLGEDNPDEYVVTLDEGATWKRLFLGKGDLPGLAISPDGKTIHIGGSVDGIHMADLEKAVADGPAAFQRVYEYGVWSLKWTAEGLLAGGNNYGATGEPEFMLGVSTDGGRTFTPLMTVCDLEFSVCPAASTVGQYCKPVWETQEGQPGFHEEYVAPRCASSGSPDGGGGSTGGGGSGGSSATGEEEGGCGCTVPNADRESRALLYITLALGLVFRRRSRTRLQRS